MLPTTFLRSAIHLTVAALAATPLCLAQTQTGWPVYNGGVDGDHYSKLTQINRDNVRLLQQAWVYDTGEKGGIQTNPLIVGGTLYAYTPKTEVIALDAATGKLKWKFFRPGSCRPHPPLSMLRNPQPISLEPRFTPSSAPHAMATNWKASRPRRRSSVSVLA